MNKQRTNCNARPLTYNETEMNSYNLDHFSIPKKHSVFLIRYFHIRIE